MWDLTIHPPLGPSVLTGTRSPLQSMWVHTNPPLFGAQRPRWHTAQYPPPFWAQCPRWHTAQCLALIPFVTCQNPPLTDIVLFGLSLRIFRTRLPGGSFHTLINNALFLSPTNVRSHNPPPLEPSILVGTRYSLQSMWDLTNPPPFAAQCPPWHIAWCLTSIPFVTAQTHR